MEQTMKFYKEKNDVGKKRSIIVCPYCNSNKIKRDGNTIKGFQRYFCYFCHHYWQDNYIRKSKNKALSCEKEYLFDWVKSYTKVSDRLFTISKENFANCQLTFDISKEKTRNNYIILLALPCKKYHGLWINLKTKQDHPNMEELDDWFIMMKNSGYAIKISHGWEIAVNDIISYLDLA